MYPAGMTTNTTPNADGLDISRRELLRRSAWAPIAGACAATGAISLGVDPATRACRGVGYNSQTSSVIILEGTKAALMWAIANLGLRILHRVDTQKAQRWKAFQHNSDEPDNQERRDVLAALGVGIGLGLISFSHTYKPTRLLCDMSELDELKMVLAQWEAINPQHLNLDQLQRRTDAITKLREMIAAYERQLSQSR